MARAFPSAVIENLRPLIDGGRYPIKRVVGDDLAVEADVFKDGHDVVAARLKWRRVGEPRSDEIAVELCIGAGRELADQHLGRLHCRLGRLAILPALVQGLAGPVATNCCRAPLSMN